MPFGLCGPAWSPCPEASWHVRACFKTSGSAAPLLFTPSCTRVAEDRFEVQSSKSIGTCCSRQPHRFSGKHGGQRHKASKLLPVDVHKSDRPFSWVTETSKDAGRAGAAT